MRHILTKNLLILFGLMLLPVIGIGQIYNVTTLAGSGGTSYADGTGTAASFNSPSGVAVDAVGNLYVADYFNDRIRKINPAGVVTTLAGSGNRSFADGPGTFASFNGPSGVAVDALGNVYVADYYNHRIRKISPAGIVTTLAGSSGFGSYADGPGTVARFNNPTGVAIDAAGNVYVADDGNHRIRKISSDGVVTTLAGSGVAGYNDGIGTAASFNRPIGVAVDTTGNVYVADASNHRIRKITPVGLVTTMAGSAFGYSDGTGAAARFNFPTGVAVDVIGNVYVADASNHRIRKISPARLVTTLAGTGNNDYSDGRGTMANLYSPDDLAVDATGNLYVADAGNNRIRKLMPCFVPQPPTITGNSNLCTGGSTILTSSAEIGNLWNTGDTTRSITVNTAGSYTVRATSGICTSLVSNILNVFVNSPSSSTISRTICQGSSYIFGGLSRITSGTYRDTLRNSNSCDSVVTLTLTVNPVPTTPIISGITTICFGSSSILTASTAAGYLWSTGETTQTITVSTTGIYSVQTITSGCTSALSAATTVSVTPLPTTPVISGTTTICSGSSTILTASTSAGYLWNTGDTTQSIMVNTAGSYSVQTIIGNCRSAASAITVVTENPTPEVPVVQVSRTNLLGTDSSVLIIVNVRPNCIYEWSNGQLGRRIVLRTSDTVSVRAVLNDCASEYSLPVIITGLKKNNSRYNIFEIYPNPASNEVTIRTSGTGTLEILNTLGQVVITQPGTETNEINISKLAKGVYTVKFNGVSQKLVVR